MLVKNNTFFSVVLVESGEKKTCKRVVQKLSVQSFIKFTFIISIVALILIIEKRMRKDKNTYNIPFTDFD